MLHRVIDATKAVAEIMYPQQIAEIVFFLLPTSPLPAGSGAVLYYSAPPFANWELLGCIVSNINNKCCNIYISIVNVSE
jgi:Protein of unknown function (DUF775)